VRSLNRAPLRPGRRFVLYWMTSFRRLQSNFALDRAVEHARTLERPLLVLEALRVGYPYASDRLHAFVLEGMAGHLEALEGGPAGYYPYVERTPGGGAGLLEALAREACVVVGDDWPCLFVPAMQAAAARRLDVALEVVDSNGLYPMRATTRVFTTAHSFRVHLQKELPRHLGQQPRPAPLARLRLPPPPRVPPAVLERWPAATRAELRDPAALCARLPIDHQVAPVALTGGEAEAGRRLGRFTAERLADYELARNLPEVDGTSTLSPYLHFGHLSTHQVLAAIAGREGWFHGYLRMLWGKKILEWSQTPRQALATMEALMGRYALDGRDPVSWAGYLWVLGRFDRAWGPERQIFGKVRYMSSENTARKVPVKQFLRRHGPPRG
jgi:deoxyribodipyrimidine photo-lyase